MKTQKTDLKYVIGLSVVFTAITNGELAPFEGRYKSDQMPYTIFYNTNSNEKLLPFINAVTAASGYSTWTNQIRNGSGNQAEFTSRPSTNGYFSQTLQALSSYDLYFASRIRRMQSELSSTDSLRMFIAAGPMEEKELGTSVTTQLSQWFNHLVGAFIPFIGLNLREYPSNELEYVADAIRLKNSNLNRLFNQSVGKKYDEIVKLSTDNSDPNLRLLALMARYTPLALQWDAQVLPSKSYSRFELYFPALGLLNRGQGLTDVNMWKIDPIYIDLTKDGQKPIENDFARINRIVYDGAAKSEVYRHRMVRTQFLKDYADVDHVKVITDFGRLGTNPSLDQIVSLDLTQFEDGVLLLGKPLPHTKIRDWKDRKWPLNKVYESLVKNLNRFEIAISVQRLAMTLTRLKSSLDTSGRMTREAFEKDYPFVPHYDSDASQIAFRLKFNVENTVSDKVFLSLVKTVDSGLSGESGKLICRSQSGNGNAPFACQKTFSSLKNYSSWMNNLMITFVKHEVDDGASKELPEAHAQLDKQIGDLVTLIMESFSQGKNLLNSELLNTGKKDK